MVVPEFFIEKLINLFSLLFPTLFKLLKYTLVIILIGIGILFLLSLRGIYFKQKIFNLDQDKNNLHKTRLILGSLYILIGLGIMFNYLTYLLIWIFEPFKGFIFILIMSFINNTEYINQLILPFIALGSIIAILQYVLSLFYFIKNKYTINKPNKSSYAFILSILEITMFGFECFPFFIS